MASEFSKLFKDFHILAHDEELYKLAFTHSSCNGMVGTRHQDYERLEFLGDSVIGMVVSELCYVYHPNMEQGELSMLKAQFIRSSSEAAYCRKLGLNQYIKVGASFSKEASNNDSLLEDIFESFVGAVYLDQGVSFTRKMLLNIFEKDIENAKIEENLNPKSRLQEFMQAESKESVVYKIIDEKGSQNDKIFYAGVFFDNILIGTGCGKSKKIAETEAARDALAKRVNTTPKDPKEGA